MHNLRNWHYWHNMHNLHMHLPQHCTLPPHSSGRKALDYLPKRASLGGLYSLLAVSCIMCMTSLQRSQVSVQLNRSMASGFITCGRTWSALLWRILIKTASEMDELLATEIGMYVCPPQFSLSTRIICIICIIGIIGIITCIISYQ